MLFKKNIGLGKTKFNLFIFLFLIVPFFVYSEQNQEGSYTNIKILDKITAKSSQIFVKFNEVKKFGPLEIKILKCGKVENNNILDDVAYMQVKDLSKNENEKVFIFNGWTFASDPNLTPFDHAIYDLQLVNCQV